MSKTVLFIFLLAANFIFSQKNLNITILDSFKNEVDVTDFRINKIKKISSVKKLRKTKVFEFSLFFCNGNNKHSINTNVLPKRLSIHYTILEKKDNESNKTKYFLHCFVYSLTSANKTNKKPRSVDN